jgi:hypothetical protein
MLSVFGRRLQRFREPATAELLEPAAGGLLMIVIWSRRAVLRDLMRSRESATP